MSEIQQKIDYNNKQILWLEKRLDNPRVSDYDIWDGLKKLLDDYRMDNERLKAELEKESKKEVAR